jgi:hypothetical protein
MNRGRNRRCRGCRSGLGLRGDLGDPTGSGGAQQKDCDDERQHSPAAIAKDSASDSRSGFERCGCLCHGDSPKKPIVMTYAGSIRRDAYRSGW